MGPQEGGVCSGGGAGNTQIELRYAALRVIDSGRQARLVASLAREGQHSPVLAVVEEDDRYVLIDGYRRVTAMTSLGRDDLWDAADAVFRVSRPPPKGKRAKKTHAKEKNKVQAEPDDHGSSDRRLGAPLGDPRVRRSELPDRRQAR